MKSPDHWQEFRDLHQRLKQRWDQASPLERGVLVWEAAEAKRRALEHERRKADACHVEQAAP